MSIGWILGAIFLLTTLIFIAICFFLPEWVGITGAKARRAIKDHEQESKPETLPPPPSGSGS